METIEVVEVGVGYAVELLHLKAAELRGRSERAEERLRQAEEDVVTLREQATRANRGIVSLDLAITRLQGSGVAEPPAEVPGQLPLPSLVEG